MSRLNKVDMEWVATTMRRLWLISNGFIYQDVFQSLSKVAELARISMEEFQSTNELKKGFQSTTITRRMIKKWIKETTL